MKNTEYRKGNLVHVQHGPHTFLATIAAIKKDDDLIVELRNGVCYIHSSEDVSGIPITEEWLERFAKNGLIADGLVAEYWYRKLQIKYSKTTKKCIAGIVFENHPVFLRTLEYVHELQNLFFALTGEELELKKEVADGTN
jgi:hypothetical protein